MNTYSIAQTATGIKPAIVVAQDPHSFAYRCGAEDAAAGEPYCPEMLFIRDREMLDYTLGFLSVRPDCRPAQVWFEQFVEADGYEQEAAFDQMLAVRESMTGAW